MDAISCSWRSNTQILGVTSSVWNVEEGWLVRRLPPAAQNSTVSRGDNVSELGSESLRPSVKPTQTSYTEFVFFSLHVELFFCSFGAHFYIYIFWRLIIIIILIRIIIINVVLLYLDVLKRCGVNAHYCPWPVGALEDARLAAFFLHGFRRCQVPISAVARLW